MEWWMNGLITWALLSAAGSWIREKKDTSVDKHVQSQTQSVSPAGAPGVVQEIWAASAQEKGGRSY